MYDKQAHEAEYRAIRAAAFERYVLDLMRLLNEKMERGAERRGQVLEPALSEFKLAGEFPRTSIQMKVRYQKTGQVVDDSYVLWGRPEHFDKDKDYEQLVDEGRIVSDIMMWARGG